MTLSSAIGFAGVLNGALLALMAAFSARRDARAGWLSALLASLSFAVAAILISHGDLGEDALVRAAAVAVEQTVALASGPILLGYIGLAARRPITARLLFLFAPAVVMALVAPPLIALRAYSPLPSLWVVVWQAAFTAVSVWIFVRERDRGDRSAEGQAWPLAVVVTMAVIHAAQLARLLGLADGNDRDIVAVAGAVCACGLVALALSAARFVGRNSRRYAKSPLGDEALTRIFAESEAALRARRLHRDPDLGLAGLAETIGVPARHLSQAISKAGGTSFNAWMGRLRAEDAARLMAEPGAEVAAVEALGMEAGFGSRSAFYEAFRKRFGCTPAAYRRQIVSAPRGPDMESKAKGPDPA